MPLVPFKGKMFVKAEDGSVTPYDKDIHGPLYLRLPGGEKVKYSGQSLSVWATTVEDDKVRSEDKN